MTTENTTSVQIAQLCDKEGWGAHTRHNFAADFIKKMDLENAFLEFLNAKASEFDDQKGAPARADTLKKLGFEVLMHPDSKAYYWEHDVFGASEDFDTAKQAWLDAYEHYVKEEKVSEKGLFPAWKNRTLERRLASLRQMRANATANEAFESYDFGAIVEATSGWTTDSNFNFEKNVYLCPDDPAADTIRVKFFVSVDPDNLYRCSDIRVAT